MHEKWTVKIATPDAATERISHTGHLGLCHYNVEMGLEVALCSLSPIIQDRDDGLGTLPFYRAPGRGPAISR
jgi:hypothetical protein